MSIKLSQANRMIAAIIKRGIELDCRPISVVVVEPGCIVKAFQKEDGASMMRFEMAFGKAYAALALSRSSKLVRIRNEEKPVFMRYLMTASGDKIFAEGGGQQIRDKNGEVIGAVGVIELDHPVDVVTASRAAAGRGVWIRPFRELVYTMPPYVVGDDDLQTICDGLLAAAAAR